MCIICAKPIGVKMPSNKYIENMWENNPDGAGLMYAYNGKVIIEKGFMTLESFMSALERIQKKVDLEKLAVILHFRIGTAGGNTPENTHPFPISDNIGVLKKLRLEVPIGVVHNGIISITPRQKDISDTMEYIAAQLAPLHRAVPNFYENKNLMLLVKNAISSKMAFLIGDGTMFSIGEFVTEDGIFYSNSAYSEVYTYRNLYGNKYSSSGKYTRYWEDLEDNTVQKSLMWLDDEETCIMNAADEIIGGDSLSLMDEKGVIYRYDADMDYCIPAAHCRAISVFSGLPVEFDSSSVAKYDVLDEPWWKKNLDEPWWKKNLAYSAPTVPLRKKADGSIVIAAPKLSDTKLPE